MDDYDEEGYGEEGYGEEGYGEEGYGEEGYGEEGYGEDYGEGYGEDYGEDEEGDERGDYPESPDFGGEESDDSVRDWTQDMNVVAGYDDFQRTGQEGYTGCWEITKEGKAAKVQTPLGRFCLRVDAVSRSIISDCNLLSQADIVKLLQYSEQLPRVGFRNATAFVLGYVATNRGTSKLTKATLDQAYRCYEKMQSLNKDDSIKKADIIRYARLWTNLLK